jgi:protein gp37
MEMARRLEAMGVGKYRNLTRRSGKRTIWNGIVKEDEASLGIPYKWKKPRKIFVNSMSDLFHEQVTDEFILKIWKVMHENPWHNFQILTKRPDRMAEFVKKKIEKTLPNVWLGTRP